MSRFYNACLLASMSLVSFAEKIYAGAGEMTWHDEMDSHRSSTLFGILGILFLLYNAPIFTLSLLAALSAIILLFVDDTKVLAWIALFACPSIAYYMKRHK